MSVLVLGGGGFIGSGIVRQLCGRGIAVTVLGRRPYPHLEQIGARTVQADVRDAAAVTSACRNVETVFHTAALTDLWGARRRFWEVNVGGTHNVLAACRESGVRHLIYTSTPSVVFGTQELCGVNESQPYPRRHLAHYPASKAAAEQMVLQANGSDLATVALRPHLVWGPGDPHLIPRILDRARRGQLRQVGRGANLVDITYIDNAVDAHLRAWEALGNGDAAGRAYFISQGRPVRLWPWLNDLLHRAGIPPVTRSVSFRVAYGLGALCEVLQRVSGRRGEPRMTRFLALQLATSHYFDISAARRDLGYRPQVATAEGLERLLADLRS